MLPIADQTLLRLERRVWQLAAWRNRAERDVGGWTAQGPAGERPLRPGERWDEVGWPARLAATLPAPAPPGWLLELDVEGEALLRLDGAPAGGLNVFHREVPAGGARLVEVEAVPKGLFGEHVPAPRLRLARLVEPDPEARALHRELALAWEACVELGDDPVVPHLVRAIEESLALVRLPTASEAVLAGLAALRRELALDLPAARALVAHYRYPYPLHAIERLLAGMPRGPWSGAPGPLEAAGPPPPLEGVDAALAHLRERLAALAERFPPEGRLAAVGHAHLDLAWLWPLAETRRKARRTAATVLALMERDPDLRFAQSSAQVYAFLREDDPALYERVRARVAEGRWEAIGGMWVEPDCNLTGGESLVRQLLHGQRFFERELGARSPVAWLPDTFGFTAALPQILAAAGIRAFFTQKLTWNETNEFPYDLWLWEGIDGTRVLAHSFDNPAGGYNAQVAPRATLATWANFRGKTRHDESLFAYGYGDGGGGPTADMVAALEALRRFPALPRPRHATVREFFERVDPNGLPVWSGELYFELHRGTYTSQGQLKRLHRAAEHRLYEAEAAATLAALHGAPYPREPLHAAWTALLRNQFHDILPGSSIREVNEEAERELADVVARAEALRDEALAHLTARAGGRGERIVVFNLHGADRPLSCVVPFPAGEAPLRLLAPDGAEVPYQRVGPESALVHDPDRLVPGLGYLALAVAPGERAPVEARVAASPAGLETDLLRVAIAPDGTLASVVDRRAGREALAGPGNQLWAYRDLPREWEAWDIDASYPTEGEPVAEVEAIRVVEAGPLRAAVEVTRRYGASRIRQRYEVRAGSARLDIRTRIDWRERRVLLRALFPLAVRADEATYEIAYGAVARSARRSTRWDAARFEVPAHRWADLSEPGFGVSLLNDGRYGHSALDGTLGLSLLRSPAYPDPLADAGEHAFSYSLLPHPGAWHEGETLREAIDLNSPLVAVAAGPGDGDGPLPPAGSLLRVEGLAVGALKRAEEGEEIVLRLYDPVGRAGVARLAPGFPLARAALVDLLEEDAHPLDLARGEPLALAYRPFQILTLRLAPAGARV